MRGITNEKTTNFAINLFTSIKRDNYICLLHILE